MMLLILDFQSSCAAIAAILQYLLLVAFALMTVLSVTLYWKVSSFTRGMQTDKTRNIVVSLIVAWGMILFPTSKHMNWPTCEDLHLNKT